MLAVYSGWYPLERPLTELQLSAYESYVIELRRKLTAAVAQ
jgi:hypothetical protein